MAFMKACIRRKQGRRSLPVIMPLVAVGNKLKLDVRLVSLSLCLCHAFVPLSLREGLRLDVRLASLCHSLPPFLANRRVVGLKQERLTTDSEKVTDSMANTVVSFLGWFPTELICDGNFPAISAFISSVLHCL